jgi:hypothetical protein
MVALVHVLAGLRGRARAVTGALARLLAAIALLIALVPEIMHVMNVIE